MAHTRLWASPVTVENMDSIGCDLLEQNCERSVGISKSQVRKKIFVLFLIEKKRSFNDYYEKKSVFKSLTSIPKTPHPHNVHLTLCVEKSICESSLTEYSSREAL